MDGTKRRRRLVYLQGQLARVRLAASLRQNQLFCLKPHGPRTRAGLPDAWLPISTADQDGLGSRLDHLFWCHSISSSARSRRELEQGVPGRACDLTLQEVASSISMRASLRMRSTI